MPEYKMQPIGSLVETIAEQKSQWMSSRNIRQQTTHGYRLVSYQLKLLEYEGVVVEEWNELFFRATKINRKLDPKLHNFERNINALNSIIALLVAETTMALYDLEYYVKREFEIRHKLTVGGLERMHRVPPASERFFAKPSQKEKDFYFEKGEEERGP